MRFGIGLMAATVVGLACAVASAGPVYFIVAERTALKHNNDSFVLPLEDPVDVAHARDLIASGPESAGASIVFAEIIAGADGVNRDVLAPGEPLWNWHVSRFEGFGDVGIELVDGWPSFIEQDVAGWIANTSRDASNPDEPGHIGFWNYTVVAELGSGGEGPPPSIPLPPAAYGGGIALCALLASGIRASAAKAVARG